MAIFPPTPSQTVGPYFAIGLPWPAGPHAVDPGDPRAIRLTGTIVDGTGEPFPDHLLEVWGADPGGVYPDLHEALGPAESGFRGFARCGYEGGDGSFEVVTLKPGRVALRDGRLQAPHLAVSLFGRGMLQRLVTRVYFADEEQANAEDPVLRSVPADRRATLLAEPADGGYRWDVVVQDRADPARETVFFAV